MNMLRAVSSYLFRSTAVMPTTTTCQVRNSCRYPPWELHIRFDPSDGRKVPCKDILDRFKRLNNGLWIRGRPGRSKKRYQYDERNPCLTSAMHHVTVTDIEGQICERLVNRWWVRPKNYIDDPYQPYHVRHGLKTCRVGFNNRMCRERPKILIEDTISDQHFYDR